MGFNRDVIRRRRDQLHEWGVRMRWVGRRPRLWRSVINELEVAQELTRDNTGLTLYFCVNYGGRAEIADAVQRHRRAGASAAGSSRASIDEKTIARYLHEPDMPDVDLFVRSLRRAAHQQLPAVAVRLRRDGLPRHPVAGLRPSPPVGSHRDVCRARPPLRRRGGPADELIGRSGAGNDAGTVADQRSRQEYRGSTPSATVAGQSTPQWAGWERVCPLDRSAGPPLSSAPRSPWPPAPVSTPPRPDRRAPPAWCPGSPLRTW